MTPTPKEGVEYKCASCGKELSWPTDRVIHGKNLDYCVPCWDRFTKPESKEGPPTLRECRDALQGFYDMPMSMTPDLCLEKATAMLSRLTPEALERDEKRRAALEKDNKIMREALIFLSMIGDGWGAGAHAKKMAGKALDALTPAPQEAKE